MAVANAVEEQPLRAELFSSEQMKQHARLLAETHRLSPERAPDRLLARLRDNENVLLEARNVLTEAIRAERQIAPAGEWLLDNFHLIEEQIRTAKRHLPKGYSRELPRLKDGSSAGLPRVYDLASETIAHGDGRVDPESLSGFIAAYQEVHVLCLGELWAIPIMLRLALIENLRRVSARVASERLQRNQAAYWADRMREVAREDPKSLILTVADMSRANPPMASSFVAEFTRRLKGQGSPLALPLSWMEQTLWESGLSIDALIEAENQLQAAEQVTISNSISSLRSLGATDWREFVETLSIVEQTLRKDPAGQHGRMDFATRDRYRHSVEKVAKQGPLTESEVAAKAVRLAEEAAASFGSEDRRAHVGYYLVDRGLPQLEGRKRLGPRGFLGLYLGGVLLLSAVATLALTAGLSASAPVGWGVGLAVLGLLGFSQLGVALVNWATSLVARPRAVPQMDFSEGVPSDCRTLVIVPTLLTSEEGLDSLLEDLEVRFLANQDPHLHFGLLTDFKDAPQAITEQDQELLRLAVRRVEELNQKYATLRQDAFFLFHRPRLWNAGENVWMGYERKRGKLAELNQLLLGEGGAGFLQVVGPVEALQGVKYVITLDTDTQLPRDAAAQLIGAMAHPLNRPVVDAERRIVREGYGLLQPRVAVSLPGANRSLYSALFSGEPGVDPYTRLVSDIHQDLFQEGSFIGKGIYEVETFEKVLGHRFPENAVLSHDLLEGCHVRAGLISDVLLYEDYPANYSADVSRRHRWIRGDWQLLRWLMPSVTEADGQSRRNPLTMLSRWKLFDNLRRSLVPVSLVLLFLASWLWLQQPWMGTLLVASVFLLQPLLASVWDFLHKAKEVTLGRHLALAAQGARRQFLQAFFALACLPYEAYYSLDAVGRTLWRLAVSRRHLLEWNPSSETERKSRTDLPGFLITMASGPVLAVGSALLLGLLRPEALPAAVPVLLLWLAAPAAAWALSRPLPKPRTDLSEEQGVFLRKLSRRTWRFFETFVGPEDHWLPPDNFQEQPVAVVAHRTSPTNMGMSLISNLAAYDFGYIPVAGLMDRLQHSLTTMQGMERHRGHFYNWYDTQTLRPLLPVYISTVDSGNLSGHLLTLRMGLLELPDQPILGPRWLQGLEDTFLALSEVAGPELQAQFTRFQDDLATSLRLPPANLADLRTCLQRLTEGATKIADHSGVDPQDEAGWWAQSLLRQCRAAVEEVDFLAPRPIEMDSIPTLRSLAQLEVEAARRARERITELESLAHQFGEMSHIELDFLFDKGRGQLAIGYNLTEHRRDASTYDLLASEARLCNFLAVALGYLPQDSWFSLGRLLTSIDAKPALLSWSGSMFEYLMPLLVMPNFENTLLDQTYEAVVERQREYGLQRNVPWGISESGYNTVDAHQNYQYRAFGVPGLGMKRGLGEDLVIAPYATVMALMVDPEPACANLQRLASMGQQGVFGFYEALDYTASRVPRGQRFVTIRSFMAHHQGMSFLSLAYLLLGQPMQRRFSADPRFQATMLLLHERVPRSNPFYAQPETPSDWQGTLSGSEMSIRVVQTPKTPTPELQLLSNGRYHVMVTNAGGGYSRWREFAITRWREDSVRDNWGTFCYLRDLKTDKVWSTAFQPTQQSTESYEAIFSEARAEFRCRNQQLDAHTEIAVSPEDDIEMRRIQLTNHSRVRRTLELTSYAEVVLAPSAADSLHPAFSNLFVQTEIVRDRQFLLCHRRPRSASEPTPWLMHQLVVQGAEVEQVSYETDRMRFVGRGNSPADPIVLRQPGPLSDTEGSVLDPIVAIRCRLVLEPESTASVYLVTGISETRQASVALAEKYHDRRLADRVFDLAWTHGQVVLRQLNATEADAQLYQRLAGYILYSSGTLRADAGLLAKNRKGQSGLWGYSVSGDQPIVLLQIGSSSNMGLVRQMVQAHAYWRMKGLAADLVIWNEDHSGYRQALHDEIVGMIATSVAATVADRPGGIFVRPAEQISSEDRILLQTVARAIITDSRGSLAEQLERPLPTEPKIPRLAPARVQRGLAQPEREASPRERIFFNGLGGFTPDGREYIITTTKDQRTPAPWVNVLANPRFGTVVSESGSAYTWSENAHEYRLTPWHNDPVSDASGEAFYVRDEETGQFWSPTPLPCAGTGPYISRHGFGYSVFEHKQDGIRTELWVYVAIDAPVKFWVLKLKNESGRHRRLSATGYIEWVLGDLRPKSVPHMVTEVDPESGALLARNPYSMEFPDRVSYFDVDGQTRSFTGDRQEFLGRNGSLKNPSALERTRLSGKVGAGLEPCSAIQLAVEVADGQERELVFRMGAGRNADEARALIHRFRGAHNSRSALENVWHHWKHTLGAVHVETPDPALNVLANGWLIYQTLSSRLWGRSGYYQSGGAFGFRDQLQDVMALLHAAPHLMREQLLLSAAHQFPEGDVLHWWHPPLNRGVRTRCSDDYLWLPLVACRYVLETGDTGVLDEMVPFVEGRPLNAGEESYYDLPIVSTNKATLYDHCVQAIRNGLQFGPHGLPLIGSGDWNDGMNLVGIHGKGESVWLGFFLYDVLVQFQVLASRRGDNAFAQFCTAEAEALRQRLEDSAWDGEWYRRAYFDDGTPLGSSSSPECKIDSIAQSWSVLSGAGNPERIQQAMDSLDRHLVRRDDQLIQLLDPPFDSSDLDPGYIKGYVPGVRENGGQYTHAAVWTSMAFAKMGDSRRAWEMANLINPVNHAITPEQTALYKVEPYVIAADVYGVAPHTGRGGWTWYTGSAGWFYRLLVESLLGLRLEVDRLRFVPCLREDWKSYKVHYRYRNTFFHITIEASADATTTVTVDGVVQQDPSIHLVDDRHDHHAQVRVGRR